MKTISLICLSLLCFVVEPLYANDHDKRIPPIEHIDINPKEKWTKVKGRLKKWAVDQIENGHSPQSLTNFTQRQLKQYFDHRFEIEVLRKHAGNHALKKKEGDKFRAAQNRYMNELREFMQDTHNDAEKRREKARLKAESRQRREFDRVMDDLIDQIKDRRKSMESGNLASHLRETIYEDIKLKDIEARRNQHASNLLTRREKIRKFADKKRRNIEQKLQEGSSEDQIRKSLGQRDLKKNRRINRGAESRELQSRGYEPSEIKEFLDSLS